MTENAQHNTIHAVPTNLITGFLGVGKTSAILHLLKLRPSSERWAVLVNEFGEIGVDGSLFQGQHGEGQGVFIREVPGGCMCCASGLPMQIALNQLLARAQPDRLLIEPTGLGHPVEVLQTLSAEHYQNTLSLQKIITLVDARKLSDERYTGHETFNQQIAIADVVVGNKRDLYSTDDETRLVAYVKKVARKDVPVCLTQHGEMALSLLSGATASVAKHTHHHSTDRTVTSASDLPLPASGFVKAHNVGEGYRSMGWRFSPEKTFSHAKLVVLLSGLEAERMKGVFITDQGMFGYNLTADALTEIELDECMESRIEVIGVDLPDGLESGLMDCLVNV